MTTLGTVKVSVYRYFKNPVMVIPPLISTVFSLSTSFIMTSPAFKGFTPELWMFILKSLGVLFLNLLIAFLALIGQSSMAGEVVKGGRARLIDWARGVKRYFFRMVGVGLIYIGILTALFIFVGIIYAIALLPQLMQQLITMETKPPTTSRIQMPPLSSATLMVTSTLLMSLAFAVFLIWLAPIVVDDKGVLSSIEAGTKAIKGDKKSFIAYFGLFYVVSVISRMISTFPVSTACYIGRVTPIHIASQIVTTFFSPLWFLMAFTIYHEKKPVGINV